MPARRYRITGLVQGVFFRAETERKAQELGLTGWVRNIGDGSVDVWAEGDNVNLIALYTWLTKGPERAEVENVEEMEVEPRSYNSFSTVHSVPATMQDQLP